MANPEYQESLDFIDKLSVILYRLGISLFAFTLLCYSGLMMAFLAGFTFIHDWQKYAMLSLSIATALSAANIHVYNKIVRSIIAWSGWIGIVTLISTQSIPGQSIALGFMFITFSGIALKESFCFRVTGLKLIPILLAVSTFSLFFQQDMFTTPLLFVSALILGYLSVAKWAMPLHFDIGIKANYQI